MSADPAPVVRAADDGDITVVAAMKLALWPDGTEDEYRAETRAIAAGRAPSTLPLVELIAEQAGEAIGFAQVGLRSHADGCSPAVPAGYLEGWYVLPEWRGRGVGRALVDAACAWAAQQGAVEFASDTWADNPASVAAHEALGFEVVDTCVNFRRRLPTAPVVHALGPADWQRFRALRLAALLDAPDAFARTFDDEAVRPDGFWRDRLAGDATTLVCTLAGNDAGVCVVARSDRAGDRGLYGVWVAPWARGRGVGDALVDAALEEVRRYGARGLVLDVGEANDAARALYERHGFRETGRASSLPPPRAHVVELEMRAPVEDGGDDASSA